MSRYVSCKELEGVFVSILKDALDEKDESSLYNMIHTAYGFIPTICAQYLFMMNEFDTERARIVKDYISSFDSRYARKWGNENPEFLFAHR